MEVVVNKIYTITLQKAEKQLLQDLLNNAWDGFGGIDPEAVTDLVAWCEKLNEIMEDAE